MNEPTILAGPVAGCGNGFPGKFPQMPVMVGFQPPRTLSRSPRSYPWQLTSSSSRFLRRCDSYLCPLPRLDPLTIDAACGCGQSFALGSADRSAASAAARRRKRQTPSSFSVDFFSVYAFRCYVSSPPPAIPGRCFGTGQ